MDRKIEYFPERQPIEGPRSIRIGGELRDFSRPWVMGIINATPDSFFSGSRTPDAGSIKERSERMVAEGVDCFDVGGYSSRPGAEDISPDEEKRRLGVALEVLRSNWPEIPVSVDTFRADVARWAVRDFQVDIINDIAGGILDEEMFSTVAELNVAYVLMHMRGNPATMQQLCDYSDVTAEVVSDLAFKLNELRLLGVADVIIDPGFGFAKTTEQNFELLAHLEDFKILDAPILAGLSRKSMIWRSLHLTPIDSLNGTTALNMVSLLNGADILRVHDVKEARQTVDLFLNIRNAGN